MVRDKKIIRSLYSSQRPMDGEFELGQKVCITWPSRHWANVGSRLAAAVCLQPFPSPLPSRRLFCLFLLVMEWVEVASGEDQRLN